MRNTEVARFRLGSELHAKFESLLAIDTPPKSYASNNYLARRLLLHDAGQCATQSPMISLHMSETRKPSVIDSYLREANAFGEWKSTDGFADPLLDLLDAPKANNEPEADGEQLVET